ncbi:MAG: DUF3460 family protein [Pseudomonadota bacterium]
MPIAKPSKQARRSAYVSEFSAFLDAYLAQHPAIVDDQRKAWDIWWDRKVDFHELELARSDTVPLPPYAYP